MIFVTLFRWLFYLAILVVLFFTQHHPDPVVRGAVIGFLVTDCISMVIFTLVEIPMLSGQKAVFSLLSLTVTLWVIRKWGFDIPTNPQAMPAAFFTCLVTGGFKVAFFSYHLTQDVYDLDED